MKSEGVKDVVKWLEEEIKDAKKELEFAKKNQADFGRYEDCGDSYDSMVVEAQVKLSTLVSIKIQTERYAKKLKYEEQGK
ncbi:hypothetical protein [Serratia sp. Se-RSBMAAmG]|uniref:hypothetical protein n=1 Tax=Serratia sp. Se-RSBMAAmG TaxID=3043305 RepID=UPI0024B00029|nr:hypothetical protein [Serratia sp. Se-RSBMAAmG]MDI6977201.1 hypothetical protein [Serratia sp. Se-RSBMAAmG]